MKSQLLVTLALIAATLLLGAIPAQAENKIFNESGVIIDGDVWNMVDIYNDDTVVDMSGGMCDYITTYNGSTLNITGGQAQVGACDYSTVKISGGTISNSANAYLNSTIYYSGSAYGQNLGAFDSGKVYMTGGTVENIGSIDSSIFNLYGGYITDSIFGSGSSIINIFGYDLSKTYSGGTYGNGQVSGYFTDNSSFTIDLYGASTYEHIYLIPEPTALLLFSFGCLFLKRKR